MIIAVVQNSMPRRQRDSAIAAERKSALAFRARADRGISRKVCLNGKAGGGAAFAAEPIGTNAETCVTVDNINGEMIVRESD